MIASVEAPALRSGPVPLTAIKVGERKRETGDISQLLESMRTLGLLNPITIQPDGTLIAGYHRLLAAKALGWTEIDARVVDLDTLNAELAEIDENLVRNDLHWFEKDKQLARRKEIYEALYPETKHGTLKKIEYMQNHTVKRHNVVSPCSFAQDTATKLNITSRTVGRSLKRAQAFTDEEGEVLKRARVKPTEATQLARLDQPVRKQAIRKLAESVERGKSKPVNVAIMEVKRERQDQEAAQVQAQIAPPVLSQASWQEWLPMRPPCDLLVTDPPYMTDVEDIAIFAGEWLPVALNKVKPTGRAYVCIGAYPDELRAYLQVPVPAHLRLTNILVWTYKNRIGPSPRNAYKANWQAILYYVGVDAPVIEIPVLKEQFAVQEINAPDGRIGNLYHPWQKPDELAERFIRHSSQPGDLVYDCFAGTGSFLLAAYRLGRQAVGCEISPDMLELAHTRGCEVLYAG